MQDGGHKVLSTISDLHVYPQSGELILLFSILTVCVDLCCTYKTHPHVTVSNMGKECSVTGKTQNVMTSIIMLFPSYGLFALL